MVTLTYRAKVFQRRHSCAIAPENLPVVGIGENREEAMQNAEYGLQAHLGCLLFHGKRFPKSYRGEIENNDYVAIRIESNSIQPHDPFYKPATGRERNFFSRLLRR